MTLGRAFRYILLNIQLNYFQRMYCTLLGRHDVVYGWETDGWKHNWDPGENRSDRCVRDNNKLHLKYNTDSTSVVDPDPNCIRIQQFCGSVFRIRIWIHTGKKRIHLKQKMKDCRQKFPSQLTKIS